MFWDKKTLKTLPKSISLEKFRTFCHISKLTARYYVKSGLLKSTCTRKQTHSYTIQKTDLIQFLKDYEKDPEKYACEKNWYCNTGHMLMGNRMMSKDQIEKNRAVYDYALQEYYVEYLADYPDLLTIEDVIKITGYSRSTIKNWYHKGMLKYLCVEPKLLVPKKFLLEFLTSDTFNAIIRKTDTHIEHLIEVKKLTDTDLVKKGSKHEK